MEGGSPVYCLKVSAGSADNLKPELFLTAFYKFLGQEFDPLSVQIHRLDVYARKNGEMVSLGEMGEIIS